MVDVVTPEVRSRMMAGIRSRNTRPEKIIRSALHRLGYRFRIHSSSVPGKPDLVLPRYRAAIFVHGCFWHGHDCHLFKWPQSRPEFWLSKINANRSRDEKVRAQISDAKWRRLVIWECALKGKTRHPPEKVLATIDKWLQSKSGAKEIRGKI